MQVMTECNLAKVVVDLLDGKTLIFPTETSYGLGCDATNLAAVEQIFKIKGRPSDKPLLIVVPTIEMAKKFLKWNDGIEKVAQKYWPGPVTVVGEYKNDSGLVPGVVSKNNSVAVRVTQFELTKSITEKMNGPLVATSANITDAGDMYSADDVVAMFKDREIQPDNILNFGVLPKRLPTTIVDLTSATPKILRQGGVVLDI